MFLTYLPVETVSLIIAFLVAYAADLMPLSCTCKAMRGAVLAAGHKTTRRRWMVLARRDEDNAYVFNKKTCRIIAALGANDFVVTASDAAALCTEWAGIHDWASFEERGIPIPDDRRLKGLSIVRITNNEDSQLFPSDNEVDVLRGSSFRLSLSHLNRLSVSIYHPALLCQYIAENAPQVESLRLLTNNSEVTLHALQGADKTGVRSLWLSICLGTRNEHGVLGNSLKLDRDHVPHGLTSFTILSNVRAPCVFVMDCEREDPRLVNLDLTNVIVEDDGAWAASVKHLTTMNGLVNPQCMPLVETYYTDGVSSWSWFPRLRELTVCKDASKNITTTVPWSIYGRIPSGVTKMTLDLTCLGIMHGVDPCSYLHFALALAPLGLRRLVVLSSAQWTDGRGYIYSCPEEDTFAYPPEDTWGQLASRGHAYPPGYGFIRRKYPNVAITWWIEE